MPNRISKAICLTATICLLVLISDCCRINTSVSVKPNFKDYKRTAIFWHSRGENFYETLFLTFWLENFPEQTLVERKELSKVIREQDLLRRRINKNTRVELHRLLGVEALIIAEFNLKKRKRILIENELTDFNIKVLDAETGEIAASAISNGYSRCNDSIIIETIKKIKMNIENNGYRTLSP